MYNLPMQSGEYTGLIPVKANTKIEAGGLFGVDSSGYAVNIAATGVAKVAGRAEQTADNTGGANGAISIQGRRGALLMQNSSSAALTSADFGTDVYAQNAETVRGDQDDAEAVAGTFLGFADDGSCIVLIK
jgi:hypothetical protein